MTADLGAEIQRIMARLTPHERATLTAKLVPYITYQRALLRFPTPGHLSQFHRPEFVQTPMLDVLDEAIMAADRGEARRVIVNTPPQEGKTSRLQDGCGWLLLRNPRRRIVFASYEQSIAAQSSLEVRRLFETHGGGYRGQALGIDHKDVLGLRLDPDRAQQTAWSLSDVPGKKNARPGSVVAVGVGSSLSGRPADIIVIDDPIKDSKQADSKTWRESIKNWYQSVVIARLPPKSVIVVVQTRWHTDDLTGWLLEQDRKTGTNEWTHLNIPAQAEGENDILGRKPGEYMISARARTAEDWERRKIEVGTRWWFAMYQGDPSPPEGGIYKREWFSKFRIAEAPDLVAVTTVIDPADNDGDGDEAGIITGGIGKADGKFYLLEDNSGNYTVGGWVRAALFAMLRNGAGKLAYEQSLSQLRKAIALEWKAIRRQARELVRAQAAVSKLSKPSWPEIPSPSVITMALKALGDEDDTAEDLSAVQAQLVDLWPYAKDVLALPETGPPVSKIVAKGSKSLRAELASPLWEGGKVRLVGNHPKLEHQMATWLPTQDSPDRMDAAVHWTHLMSASSPGKLSAPSGTTVARRLPPMPVNLRSTRRGRV